MFCQSVTGMEANEWEQCTGCHRPLIQPQPLCCHLLTRGRLKQTLPLVLPPCPALSRPMRREVRAACGECGSGFCHIRAAAEVGGCPRQVAVDGFL